MRGSLATSALLAVGLLVPLGPAASAAAVGGTFEDRAIGFSIKPPSKLNEVPLASGEIWTVGNWAAKREDSAYNKEDGRTYVMAPTLQAVAFIDEYIESSGDEDEVKLADGDKTKTFKFRIDPYRDYMDYLSRTNSGFEVVEERSEEVDGVPVTVYEILKGSYDVKPFRYTTWVYETEVGSVALEFRCLDDKYKKYSSMIGKTFLSFKLIERTEDFDFDSSNSMQFTSTINLRKLDPEQRKLQLLERERLAWEEASSTIVDGWTAERIKGYGVLNACDKKMATRVISYVEAVTNWLEDTFPQIGPDSYVRKPIIRICRDETERDTFVRADTGYFVSNPEIITYKGDSGPSGGPWFDVNEQTFRNWFRDRDSRTYSGLPPFMQSGTAYLVGFAKPKGKKLTFPLSFLEGYLKDELKQGSSHSTIRELMTMTRETFNQGDWKFRTGEALILMRFLTEGGRNKREKEVLGQYVTNLRDVMIEVSDELDKENEDEKEPENEDEENEMARKRAEAVRAREVRILNDTFERTFGSWSDSQWDSFEKSFDSCF